MLRRLISFSLHYASRPQLSKIHARETIPKPISVIPSRIISSRLYSTDITFESASDETLESLCEHIEELIDSNPKLAEADICLANGVLTLSLPEPHGTYVINKQSPNQQIWLSSPKSGPIRYDLKESKWIYKHTNESLHELLERELGKDILKMSNARFENCYFGGKD